MVSVIRAKKLGYDEMHNAMDIWNNEYPVRLRAIKPGDFSNYLYSLVEPQYYLLKNDDTLIGWAAAFTVAAGRSFLIILDGAYHCKRLGTLLLDHIKEDNPKLFAWAIDHNQDIKADGEPYLSPIDFYQKKGFTINNNLRLENDQLSAVNILWERTG